LKRILGVALQLCIGRGSQNGRHGLIAAVPANKIPIDLDTQAGPVGDRR
jgi:hypothetical protein